MYSFHCPPQKYIKCTVRKAYGKKLPFMRCSKASGANNTRNKTAVLIDRSVKVPYHLFPTMSVKYVSSFISNKVIFALESKL